MASFTDRIRERTRRINEKRAKRLGQQPQRGRRPPVADEFAPLALDRDQVAAIQSALGDQSLDPAGTSAYMAPEHTEPVLEQLADSTPREPEEATRESAATANTAQNPPSGEAVAAPPQPLATPIAASPDHLEFPKSSNVRAATLDANGVVTVEFGDGKRYRYASFTRELMKEWREAKSAGGWFHKNIRSKPERHPLVEG
jgi:hypothetical protein